MLTEIQIKFTNSISPFKLSFIAFHKGCFSFTKHILNYFEFISRHGRWYLVRLPQKPPIFSDITPYMCIHNVNRTKRRFVLCCRVAHVN